MGLQGLAPLTSPSKGTVNYYLFLKINFIKRYLVNIKTFYIQII